MSKQLLVMILGLLMISFSAFAQRTIYVNEPVQTTYVNTYNAPLMQWLRVHPADIYDTEIRNLTIRAISYAMNAGTMEIFVTGRLISRLSFGRAPSQVPVHFPPGTSLNQVRIRILGEVFVENVAASLVERRYYPAPTPIPPRYPPIPPRPRPPRHEPAPRPRPPRHEPAPRPRPPRHVPAPTPGNPIPRPHR